jgi:GDP-L-fucose synthase
MDNYDAPDLLNIGVGEDLTIADLAALVARIVGYGGSILFDPSRPDGTPRKLLDVSRIHALGWHAQIPLERGIALTYEWYLKQTFNVASAPKTRAGGNAAIA